MSAPMIAAIDVGSNAMRMAIARVENDRQLALVDNIRQPVRLGQDVFTKRRFSEEVIERASETFTEFRRFMDQRGVTRWRAVGTSAVREALNRDIFIDRVADASGIALMPIGGEEEARLVSLAVTERVDLRGKLAMLVDIGGGSVEVTLMADGKIIATESFKMGAVRLLQELEEKKFGERKFVQLAREYVDATRRRIRKEIGNQKIDVCVGTGGNVEALGDLRRELWDKPNDALSEDELESLIKKLQGMTYEERVRELDLRPDRADVIVPAAIVLQEIVRQSGVKQVLIPHVGLKDGLLLDVMREVSSEKSRLRREQALASAMQLGRKYSFDEQHAGTVARFAAQLFDDTKALHHLDDEYRLLLETAAWLHDIGMFIGAAGHHKHTYYIIHNSPLIGLSDEQRELVANIARYHRKNSPSSQHEPYRNLSSRQRVAVSKLAALLRLANALDTEHAAKVTSVSVEYKKPNFKVRLKGDGDLLLEKWAIVKKCALVEEVFGVKMAVVEE
jgi:exopolyphosphatase/guanosine-5'-triphosphate,3'-diphosphate pyrophosphatase